VGQVQLTTLVQILEVQVVEGLMQILVLLVTLQVHLLVKEIVVVMVLELQIMEQVLVVDLVLLVVMAQLL
jgi:hypothetical protein